MSRQLIDIENLKAWRAARIRQGNCNYDDMIALNAFINTAEIVPDRPQGEWRDADGNFVPLDKDGCTTASSWCSNCGEWLTGSDEHWTSGRFCPNCGCRMKGADDEA